MDKTALMWIGFTFLCIGLQGTFAMLEMAYVSFNKVKLHYYISKGSKRAKWIHKLLQDPSKLFATTLVCVNVALQIGSECSRQFYETINLPPTLSLLSQVLLVVIFAEFAPMMAGRRNAEHVAFLGAPFLLFISFLLTPITASISFLAKRVNRLFNSSTERKSPFLSREELQHAFEFQEERQASSSNSYSHLMGSIFQIKKWTAADLMMPIYAVPKIPSHTTILQFRQRLKKYPVDFFPIFYQSHHNVVGIACSKDLVSITNATRRVRDFARPPWFLMQDTTVMQILQQFRKNNQDVAIILNQQGQAVGILSLDAIIEKIFHAPTKTKETKKKKKTALALDKSFPASTKLSRLNRKYKTTFNSTKHCQTLGQLLTSQLTHKPEKGDSVKIGSFELIVEETSLLGIKTIFIRSLH